MKGYLQTEKTIAGMNSRAQEDLLKPDRILRLHYGTLVAACITIPTGEQDANMSIHPCVLANKDQLSDQACFHVY